MNDSARQRHHLAIFASGNGSNAQQICQHFAQHPSIDVACVIYNKKDARVAERAALLGVEAHYFSNSQIRDTDELDLLLSEKGVDYIVLAGFLMLMPPRLLDKYPHSVVNIHPSLLPLYGGKGMYGEHVHRAVVAAGEERSGITIHLVNQHYDDGAVLFQAECNLAPHETAESLALKIHQLEKQYFPAVIEAFIEGKPMPQTR